MVDGYMGGQIKVIVAAARCREALCRLGGTRPKAEQVHMGGSRPYACSTKVDSDAAW